MGSLRCQLEFAFFVTRKPNSTRVAFRVGNVLPEEYFRSHCVVLVHLFRHPDFAKAYNLTEVEKQAILGVTVGVPSSMAENTDPTHCRNPIERMQNFFTANFEACCHLLGNIGASFGHEFYAVPNLADSIVNSVLYGLEYIPDYRLRPIIRVIIKPYIQNCPKELFKDSVLPILKSLLPYMHQHLVTKWHNYNSEKIQDIEDQNPEAQEVVDDQLLRLVTRDFMDLLGAVTLKSRPRNGGGGAGNQPMGEEDGNQQESDASGSSSGKEPRMSELGAILLQDDDLLSTIIQTEFAGLSWDDSQVPSLLLVFGASIRKWTVSDAVCVHSCLRLECSVHPVVFA